MSGSGSVLHPSPDFRVRSTGLSLPLVGSVASSFERVFVPRRTALTLGILSRVFRTVLGDVRSGRPSERLRCTPNFCFDLRAGKVTRQI